MLRIGTIGSGKIVDEFITGVAGVADLQLTAVCSRTMERAVEYAALHGAENVFTDPEKMAQSDCIDAVYIASPNALHVEQSELFLRHGKHVLCEKPVTAYPEELERLQSLAREKGLVFMEAFLFLYQPQLRTLQGAIAQLGAVSAADFRFCQYSSHYPAYRRGELPNIFNPALETGGLMDLGVYGVYPALYLFGPPREIVARASFLRSGADCAGTVLLTYPDKTVTVTYSKSGQGQAPSEILGENGTLLIGKISQISDMTFVTRDGVRTPLQGLEPKPLLMAREGAAFCQFAENPQSPDYRENSELALQVSRALYAARQSAGIRFPRDGKGDFTGKPGTP